MPLAVSLTRLGQFPALQLLLLPGLQYTRSEQQRSQTLGSRQAAIFDVTVV